MANATNTPADIPNELIIPLRKPALLGDVSYTELRLREPTAGEMIELGADTGWQADVKAIALISGVPEPAVRTIGVRDARKASEYLGLFFATDRSTGAAG